MSHPTISKFRFRAWLLGSVALVIVFITSSCCPPALSKRPVEKNDRPAAAEMQKATSQEKKNP